MGVFGHYGLGMPDDQVLVKATIALVRGGIGSLVNSLDGLAGVAQDIEAQPRPYKIAGPWMSVASDHFDGSAISLEQLLDMLRALKSGEEGRERDYS